MLPYLGDLLTMIINHFLTGMILPVIPWICQRSQTKDSLRFDQNIPWKPSRFELSGQCKHFTQNLNKQLLITKKSKKHGGAWIMTNTSGDVTESMKFTSAPIKIENAR